MIVGRIKFFLGVSLFYFLLRRNMKFRKECDIKFIVIINGRLKVKSNFFNVYFIFII